MFVMSVLSIMSQIIIFLWRSDVFDNCDVYAYNPMMIFVSTKYLMILVSVMSVICVMSVISVFSVIFVMSVMSVMSLPAILGLYALKVVHWQQK